MIYVKKLITSITRVQSETFQGSIQEAHTREGGASESLSLAPWSKVEECCPHSPIKYDAFVKHVILSLKTCREYLFTCSNLVHTPETITNLRRS